MARPQVVDGGDGLQIWRAAANILNKQKRTAERGWSSKVFLVSPGLRLAQPGDPTDRLSVLFPLFCQKKVAESSF
jgi:hypothetical protein